jgi:hypothetical protein
MLPIRSANIAENGFRRFFSPLCYSMAVAFGMDASKGAALGHDMISPVKLIKLARKGGT